MLNKLNNVLDIILGYKRRQKDSFFRFTRYVHMDTLEDFLLAYLISPIQFIQCVHYALTNSE